jgi:hypothetical protein
MGWDPAELEGPEVLILSTQGGLREPDGRPVALGYHTGHFEVHQLVEAAARELAARPPRQDLAPDPALPTDRRLWTALQQVSGGSWGGCVFWRRSARSWHSHCNGPLRLVKGILCSELNRYAVFVLDQASMEGRS